MSEQSRVEALKRALEGQLDQRSVDAARRVRYRVQRTVQMVTSQGKEREHFLRRHGYPLNLHNPMSFNEKLAWRKLYDRNPLFPVIVDKYRVRRFVEVMLGAEDARAYLVPLLFVTRRAQDIPFPDLPEEYVVKANHGSAMNVIVNEHTVTSEADIVDNCDRWLNTTHGLFQNQWAYAKVPRRIMGETLIQGDGGTPPREIKLHMFGGRCGLIQTLECDTWYDGYTLDSGVIPTVTYYDPDWQQVDGMQGFPAAPQPRPQNLDEILTVAERLSSPFDYVRVDLYRPGDEIFFGEMTPYPHAGRGRFCNAARDFELGRLWEL